MLIYSRRPYFSDAEFYNTNPDTAFTARRLIQWCRYTQYRHLRSTPFDPGNAGLNFDTDSKRLKRCQEIGSLGEKVKTRFGSFMAIPSHGPHQKMQVRCFVTVAADSVGFIRLKSERGTVYDLPFSYSVLGGGSGWIDARVPALPGEVFSIEGHLTSGSAAALERFTAWWDDSSFPAANSLNLNQGYYVKGRPDDVHMLREFARMANAFSAYCAPIIANKWYGIWKNDGSEGMSVLGTYLLHLSPWCSQVKVRFQARRTAGTQGFRVNFNGVAAPYDGQTANITVDPGGGADPAKYQWYEATFSVTPSASPRDFILDLGEWGWSSGTRVRIATVQAWESARAVPGVAADPGYVDVDDAPIALGATIDTAHRASLVRNLASAWFSKTRWLLDDCRWDEILADGDSVGGTDNPDPLSTVFPEPLTPTLHGNASAVHRFIGTAPGIGVGARVCYAMLERPHETASVSPPRNSDDDSTAPEWWLRAGGVLNTGAAIPNRELSVPSYVGGPAAVVDVGTLTANGLNGEFFFEQFMKKAGDDQGNPDRFFLRSLGTSLYEVPQQG